MELTFGSCKRCIFRDDKLFKNCFIINKTGNMLLAEDGFSCHYHKETSSIQPGPPEINKIEKLKSDHIFPSDRADLRLSNKINEIIDRLNDLIDVQEVR